MASDNAYSFAETEAEGGIAGTRKYVAKTADGHLVTYEQAMSLLQGELSEFRRALLDVLRRSGHEAFFFETPPVTRQTIADVPFEFVLASARSLAGVAPDPKTFRLHFANAIGDHKDVAVFHNLRRDAVLVAPCPSKEATSDRR